MGTRLLLGLLLAGPAAAVETRFWEMEGHAAFLSGDLDGLSLRADGDLVLAPDLAALTLDEEKGPPQPFLWSSARDSQGNLYVGSGIPGVVYRVDAKGEAERFFLAPELEVHAVAVDSEDRVLVAASPPGRLYRLTPEGDAVLLFDSEERYIWDLVVDRDDAVYVATGERGLLFRVEPDGNVEEVFDSDEPHLVSLALDRERAVLSGSSGSGLIYRIDRERGVQVLLDADGMEVAALAVAEDGAVLAAVNDIVPPEEEKDSGDGKKEPEERLAGELPQAPAPSPGGVEDLELRDEEAALRTQKPQEVLRLRSTLYRLTGDGRFRRLWSSPAEGIHCLASAGNGRLYFGTGVPGSLYGMDREEPHPRLLARFPESQVTAITTGGDGTLYTLTSNQGRLFRATEEFGSSGTFRSPVRDAGSRADWGRVSWTADTPPGSRVELFTRTGNSARPDETWSEWSPSYTRPRGDEVASPPARYLQLRARLSRLGDAPSPRLSSVSLSFREENLAPTVSPPRLVASPEDGDGPPPRRRTISWDAQDPNDDPLSHRLEIQGRDDDGWTPLARDLTRPEYVWDTGSLPGGRYRLRVTTSDVPGNGAEMALEDSAESPHFVLDRDPPEAEILSASGTDGIARVSLRVTDTISPVIRLEVSATGLPRRRVQPVDGLADSQDERFEIVLGDLGAGTHVLEFEAMDRAGNRRKTSVSVEVAP